MSFRTFYVAMTSCALGLCGTASAASIISSTTGLSSPASTITFSEIVLPNNTSLTNQYASLGVTFSGGFYYNGCPTCTVPPPNGVAPWIDDFSGTDTSTGSQLATIALNTPTNGIAFNFASELIPYTFTAFLGATQVGQFSVTVNTTAVNGSSGWGWYGFSGVTLDSIRISTTVGGGPTNGYELDNLELGSLGSSVPEPSTMLLSGSVLLLLVTRRLRNRAVRR